MNSTISLSVSHSGKGFGIFAGKSRLAKFATEQKARHFLATQSEMLVYWAGSVSVSVENSTPKEIRC